MGEKAGKAWVREERVAIQVCSKNNPGYEATSSREINAWHDLQKVVLVASTKEKKEAIARAALDQDSLKQAPAVLVFCADKTQSEEKYGERGASVYALQDATIAAAYSQLAATAEGLSTVWVGAFEPLEVSYLIGAQPGEVPVTLIPLGYRADTARATDRKPEQEIIREV